MEVSQNACLQSQSPHNPCITMKRVLPIDVENLTPLKTPTMCNFLSTRDMYIESAAIYLRWTPHPVIVTITDNRDYIRVLLYS